MIHFLSILTLSCLVLTHTSCTKGGDSESEFAKPIVLTTKQGAKAAGDNAFSFNLFQQVATTSDDKTNAFISPLSVTMALGMLYNGTSPDARAEMAAALGMKDFSDTEINEYYRIMSQTLPKIDPKTTLAIANSIWSEKSYPVKQTFINVNKKYYDAEVQSLDFRLSSTLAAINNWCAKKTNHKIEEILDEIPDDAVMYLINAVYFKSTWKFQFDKKETKNEPFTMENGTRKDVPMMNQSATLAYYANERLQLVEMPYGNQAFSMSVLLPTKGITIDDMVKSLNGEVWNTMQANLREHKVTVKFPRFKQECAFSLVNSAKNLGMHKIFQPGGNLNGIADDPRLYVSEIRHKTFVEVNEEGTEAAAVTSVEIMRTSFDPSSPPPISFFADRPFIYLIKERSTGAILFIGRMDNPTE